MGGRKPHLGNRGALGTKAERRVSQSVPEGVGSSLLLFYG
jgi:hypothetical protein